MFNQFSTSKTSFTIDNNSHMNLHQKEYIHRVNKVIDYIEANLDKELTLGKLAEEANFSVYHFHRIFSAFTGETLNVFVKRKRIEKAASILLADKEKTISEIAYYCGFNSVSVFCRNFKDRFCCSAQNFRDKRDLQHSKNGQLVSKNDQQELFKKDYVCDVKFLKLSQMKAKIEVKEMPSMELIYCRHVGEFDLIGQAYEKLMIWAGPRGLMSSPNLKCVTVYHDDPAVTTQENIRQSACITIDEPLKAEGEFGNLSLAEATCAVGSFEIGPTEFKDAWDSVCLWIAENGYLCDDKCPYELFHNDHTTHPEQKFIVDICVPVKPM